MAQAQDDGYRYIVHMRDHFTKFSWARAIKQKTADNVAEFLYDTFLMFGPPVILQCDNGKEFSNIMEKLGNLWPTLRVIHGRPRHPQSQGMIERANGIMERKIARWMETHKQTNWASVLGQIVYTMNCEICRTTRFSPYELVFSVSPDKDRVLLDELFESGVTEEILARDSVDIESNDETESENEGNVL